MCSFLFFLVLIWAGAYLEAYNAYAALCLSFLMFGAIVYASALKGNRYG